MTAQRLVLLILIPMIATWCTAMLVEAHQWPLIVGSVLVPGGAIGHAVVLTHRGQDETADVLLGWILAATLTFAALAHAVANTTTP